MKNCDPLVLGPDIRHRCKKCAVQCNRYTGARPTSQRTEEPGLRVLKLEVLVFELVAIDGLPARAVVVRKIAALKHELRDYAMKGRASVTEALWGNRGGQ